MAYIFECDACGYRIGFDLSDEPQFARNCDNCGLDGCDECLLDGVCDSCAADPDDDDDEEGDD